MDSQETQPFDELIDMARGAALNPRLREDRETIRKPFEGMVVIVQHTPDGGKSIPMVAQGKDISPGGMCVISRYMLHTDQVGAVLFQRSDGDNVLIGMRVVYSRYADNALHESGLIFINVPDNIGMDDFRDQMGNMPDLRDRKAA